MKKLRKISLGILAALIAVSCSSDDAADSTAAGFTSIPVKLTCSIGQEKAGTRAESFNALQDGYFRTGQQIQVYGYLGTAYQGAAVYKTEEAVAGWSDLTKVSGSDFYYPVVGESLYTVYGFYPEGKATNNMTTWTVEEDQSSVENYQKSDLMFAKAVSTGDYSEEMSLTFSHKMVRLKIEIVGGGTDIRKVTLNNLNRTINITDRLNCVVGNAGSNPGDIVAMEDAEGYLPVECEVIVPAQAVSTANDLITVTYGASNDTQSFKADNNVTLLAGNTYLLHVNVATEEVKLNFYSRTTNWTAKSLAALPPPNVTPLKYMSTGSMDHDKDAQGRYIIIQPTTSDGDMTDCSAYFGDYFAQATAISMFGSGYGKKSVLCDDGKYYHFPTFNELKATVPNHHIWSGTANTKITFAEPNVEVHGYTIPTCTTYKKQNSSAQTCYMLRFCGYHEDFDNDGTPETFNKYRSAYRYFVRYNLTPENGRVTIPANTVRQAGSTTYHGSFFLDRGNNYLDIESVYLGNTPTAADDEYVAKFGTGDATYDICSEAWWNARKAEGKVVHRRLMFTFGYTATGNCTAEGISMDMDFATAWRYNSSIVYIQKTTNTIYTWSSTAINSDEAYGLKLRFPTQSNMFANISMTNPHDGQTIQLYVDDTKEVVPGDASTLLP